MATRRVNAHQCSARGADFGPGRLIAPTKQPTHGVSPAFYPHLPLIGKRQFSSLRPAHRVPIIPKSANLSDFANEVEVKGRNMDKFEEIGQRLDKELARLRKYVEEEVAPGTEKRTARFLREVSELLTDAARKLEARNTPRETPAAKDTHS
jgi:hypothetical protein